MHHHKLRSIVFVGVLALESAARAQGAAPLAEEQLERLDETVAVVFEGFVFAPDGSVSRAGDR